MAGGEPVILVCPCCASAVDATTADTAQELECLSCEQQWLMVVDAHRQAAHALT